MDAVRCAVSGTLIFAGTIIGCVGLGVMAAATMLLGWGVALLRGGKRG